NCSSDGWSRGNPLRSVRSDSRISPATLGGSKATGPGLSSLRPCMRAWRRTSPSLWSQPAIRGRLSGLQTHWADACCRPPMQQSPEAWPEPSTPRVGSHLQRHAGLLLGGANGQAGLDAGDVGRRRQLAGEEFLKALQVAADDLQDEVDLTVEH